MKHSSQDIVQIYKIWIFVLHDYLVFVPTIVLHPKTLFWILIFLFNWGKKMFFQPFLLLKKFIKLSQQSVKCLHNTAVYWIKKKQKKKETKKDKKRKTERERQTERVIKKKKKFIFKKKKVKEKCTWKFFFL